jgi:hypothetical protein
MPLAMPMLASPTRKRRRGKPQEQMIMFDSCSGASFGERKWLTALGCKMVKADTTLHFHGFCEPNDNMFLNFQLLMLGFG